MMKANDGHQFLVSIEIQNGSSFAHAMESATRFINLNCIDQCAELARIVRFIE